MDPGSEADHDLVAHGALQEVAVALHVDAHLVVVVDDGRDEDVHNPETDHENIRDVEDGAEGGAGFQHVREIVLLYGKSNEGEEGFLQTHVAVEVPAEDDVREVGESHVDEGELQEEEGEGFQRGAQGHAEDAHVLHDAKHQQEANSGDEDQEPKHVAQQVVRGDHGVELRVLASVRVELGDGLFRHEVH